MALFDDEDFEVLRADQVAEFVLHEIHIPRGSERPVVLLVKHIGDVNAGWTNAILKAPKGLTESEAEVFMNRCAAKHAIVGWKNVFTKSGDVVPYTAAGGEELLEKLRSVQRTDLLDRLMGFLRNPINFKPREVDPVELGKP